MSQGPFVKICYLPFLFHNLRTTATILLNYGGIIANDLYMIDFGARGLKFKVTEVIC